ncbi:MAG: NAD(P)H-nitrite reductase [Flavobacteriaceae bacterium]|nr:MAG: NAD(P)H-nitrite reductase [Flavobacteriaceae bacterium]
MNSYTKSICSYCGVGCGVLLKRNAHTNEIDLLGDTSHPVNKGMLCSKGRSLHHTVMDTSDRLLQPQMRWNRESPLQDVSWDTALERAAGVFKGLINNYGPDAVGFYVSGQLLTEEYYIVNKLVKGFIKTNNIDTNSRLCMSSAVVAYKKTLGEDSVPICYDDIELADCFFIAGANPAWCHPILFRRLEAHKEANPSVKIIVVDPRKTASASIADLHLQINPGTDVYLYNAIAKWLIENDQIDSSFIADHVTGFEALKKQVFHYSIEETAAICAITTDAIALSASWIGDAKGFISMWTMGLNQSSIGVNKNIALINLSLITGKIGKPGNGPFSLTGQPNAMGGREVGGLSSMLAVHKSYENPAHVEEVERFWNVSGLSTKQGLTATEMFDALYEGKLKAIWIICTNPTVSLPDARRVEAALRKAKFVIVQDISNASTTVHYADLVLPAAGYMEKTGTMTNSERRVNLVQKILDPPGNALPDAEILWRFAAKMGWGKQFPYQNYEAIYEEYKKMTQGTNLDVSGIDYTLLRTQGGVQWPYTSEKRQATKRLFEDHQFYTDSGKASVYGVDPQLRSEQLSENYPFVLLTGRVRDQWHTMTRTQKVSALNRHAPQPFVEIHPSDAEALGIEEDDLVEVIGKRGNVKLFARICDTIKKGVLFIPMHWGKLFQNDLGRANNITSPILDKESKQPDYKYAAVQLFKHRPKVKKIIVIGAGAGATQFVKSYRALGDAASHIEVFSKEIHPFYNRVLLPHYLTGEKTWKDLEKLRVEDFKRLGITVHIGVSIDLIDKKKKYVIDSTGKKHTYDTLIVATGSRAFVPPNFPKDAVNFITIRQRGSIELIQKRLKVNSHVVIIGGGLLGLEMADALITIGMQVHVVQIDERLMGLQLDKQSSKLLKQKVLAKGIHLYMNDEVLAFNGHPEITAVSLRSGQKIACELVITAIGTRPNIELLKTAEITCNRGVLINQYLQSSDKDVYCIGEIAELNGTLWGITAAAEQQAKVLAKVIYGDPHAYYKGSIFMNILKAKDVHICSIGLVDPPDTDDKDYQIIKIEDLSRQYYKKCVVYKNKLVGAILVGDRDEFLSFKDLIENSSELNDVRDTLLRPNGLKKELVKGKLLCSCANVGEGNIEEVINKTTNCDLQEVMKHTGAGTGCGSCKPEILALLMIKNKANGTRVS